jgi:spermidine/putrescine transport system permease protein
MSAARSKADRHDFEQGGRLHPLALLEGLPLGWLTLVFVLPLLLIVVYSFGHATFAAVELGFTLENFITALSGFNLEIFLRTLLFAAVGTALCAIVAIPLAYGIATRLERYRAILVVLLLIPFWTSFLIRALSWRTLLATGGPVEALLNTLHLHSGPLTYLDAQPAVFIGIVYGYLPLMALPLLVAFTRIPLLLREASKDLGAGRLRTFFSVTLPMARAGLATGVILTFVPMTGEYIIPRLLGGNKGVLTSNLISSQFLEAQNYAVGSAMAVLLLGVLGASVFALARFTRGFESTT